MITVRRSKLKNILTIVQDKKRQLLCLSELEQKAKEKKEQLDRKRRKPILISVQIRINKKIHILVDTRYDTLYNIKEKIHNQEEGINIDQMILLLNGRRLQEGITINELKIVDGACLFLILRNRGG